MNRLQKIFKQTSFQLIGKVVSSLTTIIILGIITRKFGQDGTGVFTLALTYLAFFVVAADFGVNAHVLPRFDSGEINLEWRKLLGFRLVLGLVLLSASFIIASFLNVADPQFYELILIGSFFAIFESVVFVSCNAIFQNKLSYHLSSIASSVGAIVTVVLVYVLSQNTKTLLPLMFAYNVGWIFVAVISLWLVRKFIRQLSPIIDWGYIKTLTRESWPISLTLLLNMVYFRVDAFILSANRPLSDVGIYNLAYQIFQNILVLPTFIMNGFYPMMLQAYADNRRVFFFELKKAGVILLGISLLGIMGTLVVSPIFIEVLTGGRTFEGSVTALQILSLSLPAFFVSSLLMWTFVTLKKYKLMLAIYIFGLLINSGLNLVLIPQYGFLGAAWVTVFSEYLILVLQLIILWKRRSN